MGKPNRAAIPARNFEVRDVKVETLAGALIAAVILFVSGFLALLQQDGVNSAGDISQVAWLVLAGGAVLSFLKDYQALTARRLIAKLTGSGNV